MQDSQEIYSGKIVTLRIQTVPQPIGGTTRFEIVEHPDAVAIVAVRYEPANATGGRPHVALVKQPRPAINRDTWEIPAGLVKPRERAQQQMTAERELREETGYAAGSWRKLTREYPSPGFSTEAITIYLATDLHHAEETPVAAADPAYAEISAIVWKSLDEALAMCASGEIDDGKTVLGLYLARSALNESRETTGGNAMYLDQTNPPNLQPTPPTIATRGGTPAAPQAGGIETSPALNLENILLAEFNYASTTAYQAMEDRSRTFNLYLVIFGVLASGLGALYQLGNKLGPNTDLYALALLIAAGFMGVTFFVTLIRFRQAHRKSSIAMNVIKEYYIKHFEKTLPNVKDAFYWRMNTLPKGEKFRNAAFMISSTVAMLGSLCFAAAAIVLSEILSGLASTNPFQLPPNTLPYIIGAVVFIVVFLLHVVYYRWVLSEKKERLQLEEAAHDQHIRLPEAHPKGHSSNTQR
ncbi:MAG TPA: NUDIX domain-containing protein [Ktedonobacterales bacterium]|nr:NUDIX domain-containing protein [Ktedonobacterales bacterium]